MSSIHKGIGDVRRKLDFPDPSKLSDGVIAEYLIEVTDFLITELNQTGAEWFVSSTIIDVSAGEDTYPLDGAVSGFGKARDVWSIDSSDTNHIRQALSIVSYEDLQSFYGGGNRGIGSGYHKHNSLACSFIYNQDEGRQEVVFAEVPAQSAQYKLIYEPDVVRGVTKESVNFRLRQFDALVSDKAAILCLRHCKWKGVEKDEIGAKKGELQSYLLACVAEGEEQFRRFKWSNKNPNDNYIIGFGAGRW
jgi:hypothetical protein